MYLWSIEFGLMGRADDFKLYGAGLLSSPAESRLVASGKAQVVPYSLDVIQHDIHFSDPQARYFVASGYEALHEELTRYAWRAGHPTSPN
jgi:phenylalanine-4-hydroxylase